jgi:DNA polymerase-3 subunit epsilon
LEFAIVDIETTGGSTAYHKICEIAIIIHNGVEVIERFSTLINPKIHISQNVTFIHGITNEMVANSPTFPEVAKKIFQMTENRIFVAHSVNFDFSFIKKEFENLGGEFQRKKLCTVRLSRQLVPGHRSYSLGTICGNMGISINDRHRALGDAEATAMLFTKLFAIDTDKKVLAKFLNQRSKETSLPPHVDKASFDKVPMLTGVYFFHDNHGKIIYVGKAKNLRDRVSQHFSGNTHTKTRQMFLSNIHDVSFEVTGNEFLAYLVENEAIKKHYPRYNRASKSFNLNHGIYVYEDRKGYMRAQIGKAGKRDQPVTTFKTLSEATTELIKVCLEHRLCLKLNGIITEAANKCSYGIEEGNDCPVCNGGIKATHYNKNFTKALSHLTNEKSFVIKTPGRKRDEEGFVMVEKGKFLGFGYVGTDEQISSIDQLKDYLTVCYDTQDSQSIIQSFMDKAKLISSSPMPVYSLK